MAGKRRDTCACLMILGNKEHTIRQCMDSLLSSRCFDEYIIVMDTRTRDATPAILEAYRSRHPRIRILWHKWRKQDYAEARNVGLKAARAERIYWHDGDEVMLDGPGMYSLLQNPTLMAYHIWNTSPTPYNRLVSTHQLRLFPNLTGVKWELPVHEQVVFSLRKLGVPETITNLRIWHLGYGNEASNTQKHQERAGIMRDWLRRHPRMDAKRQYIQEQYASSMDYLTNMARRPAGGML